MLQKCVMFTVPICGFSVVNTSYTGFEEFSSLNIWILSVVYCKYIIFSVSTKCTYYINIIQTRILFIRLIYSTELPVIIFKEFIIYILYITDIFFTIV